jgi:hypothetical protein
MLALVGAGGEGAAIVAGTLLLFKTAGALSIAAGGVLLWTCMTQL